MKRGYIILAMPFVFVLAVAMAWFTGPHADDSLPGRNSVRRSPRQLATDTKGTGGMSAVLLRMEERILPHNPAPPRKNYDAQGMNDVILSDDMFLFTCGSGMSATGYASGWAEAAPEEMLAWLVGQNGERSLYAYILFGSWAERDTEAALSAVFRIPDAKLRAQALILSLQVLCKSDPERARKILAQNIDLFPPDEDAMFYHCHDSGKSSIDLLVSMPPGAARTNLLARLLNPMSDSSAAVGYWNGLPESGRLELVAAGFSPYMTDAKAFDGLDDLMRSRAETSGDPKLVEEFMRCHCDAWAERDLAAALDWTQAHLKGKNRVEWRKKLFYGGITRDFEGSIRIWKSLPEGYLKADTAEFMLRAVPEASKAEAEALLKPR